MSLLLSSAAEDSWAKSPKPPINPAAIAAPAAAPAKIPAAAPQQQSDTPQNIDQIDNGEINPLNPAGDNLDKLIQLRINDDLWRAMLGELPCLDAQESCIKQLQDLAIGNSQSLRAIDERVQLVNAKIEEARANNNKAIRLGVFEPLLQAWLKVETIPATATKPERKRGLLNRLGGLFFGDTFSGINDVLGSIGIPLFRRAAGGDDATQQRTILITDLQVKVATVEKERGELAAKIREAVILIVLDFDVLRKNFQVQQEIARREVLRLRIREVDYRFTTAVTTDSYLGSESALDRVKGQSYQDWAKLRAKLAQVKLLVLSQND
ncbi:hypothetical protein ACKFKF_29770 [Phormidesmis sp. 146-12]